ncbi:hypothetical protein GWI33_001486 [Rhynchophorus ferrugineus]|uniref:Carboxypeptidase inhibitor n=1 Tax=Rhynchophorus ferrugineus TaxID=354439 RepID=A0A834MK29_RHYFE|nr:hypothetical protein GWI33_001486 [Rhynchophorus ferrugineus]
MKALIVFAVLFASVYGELESNFYSEDSCTAKGGSCVLEKECPGPLEDGISSLCSGQKSDGAVCCTKIKLEDVNCYQSHNECRGNCPEALSLGRKGCPKDSVCCVLVK